MPTDDFRAVRVVLEADDFGYAPGDPNPPPKDLIDAGTWKEIVTLPDTVAVFTSNNHGRELRMLCNLWEEWIEQFFSEQNDEIFHSMVTASDEFQAATFNALNGYYRVSIDCLRSALESVTIATYCQARQSAGVFSEWKAGQRKIGFGEACDKLIGAECMQPLSRFLLEKYNTDLFRQENKIGKGGWVRFIYSGLSDYSHSRPGFDAVHMWDGSNGPVYSSGAFKWAYRLWLQTFGTCLILIKLVRPATTLTPCLDTLFNENSLRSVSILNAAAGYLWPSRV